MKIYYPIAAATQACKWVCEAWALPRKLEGIWSPSPDWIGYSVINKLMAKRRDKKLQFPGSTTPCMYT